MNFTLLIQACLIGLFAYLGGIQTPWIAGISGGYYVLGRPLVAGLICGIIMGDVAQGVILGVAVQAAFIANVSTGGSTNSEIVYAAYGGIGLGLVSGASTGVAVSLSVLCGSLGLILYNLIMVENSYWNAGSAKAAAKGDEKGMWMTHIVGAQVCHFVIRAIPIAIAVYFGQDFVNLVLNNVPQQVIHIMDVLGGLLPALGVALLMNLLISEKLNFVYFMAGFIFYVFISNSMIALAVVACLVTVLVYTASGNSGAKVAEVAYDDDDDGVI